MSKETLLPDNGLFPRPKGLGLWIGGFAAGFALAAIVAGAAYGVSRDAPEMIVEATAVEPEVEPLVYTGVQVLEGGETARVGTGTEVFYLIDFRLRWCWVVGPELSDMAEKQCQWLIGALEAEMKKRREAHNSGKSQK